MLRKKLQIFSILCFWLLSTAIAGCSREEYPNILALGFVNGGRELSLLDINKNSRAYITNSKIIAPRSYSYCNNKKTIAYSAYVEFGEEIIAWESNYNTYALTKGNNQYSLPVWSRDCLFLAFTSRGEKNQTYILDMMSKSIRLLI